MKYLVGNAYGHRDTNDKTVMTSCLDKASFPLSFCWRSNDPPRVWPGFPYLFRRAETRNGLAPLLRHFRGSLPQLWLEKCTGNLVSHNGFVNIDIGDDKPCDQIRTPDTHSLDLREPRGLIMLKCHPVQIPSHAYMYSAVMETRNMNYKSRICRTQLP